MWILVLLCFVLVLTQSKKVEDKLYFEITADTDPYLLAKESCRNEYPNCMNLAVPSIQLYQFEKYHTPLTSYDSYNYRRDTESQEIFIENLVQSNDTRESGINNSIYHEVNITIDINTTVSTVTSTAKPSIRGNQSKHPWQYNSLCHCMFPAKPVQKPGVFQYFHIPKCGTSINFFLHDYFDNCSTSTTVPCPKWLSEPGEYRNGLCNGRLFSCGGHIVSDDFVSVSLTSPTNLISILRHPFARLRSMFFHILNNPHTEILRPDVNITELLLFIQLPSSIDLSSFCKISSPSAMPTNSTSLLDQQQQQEQQQQSNATIFTSSSSSLSSFAAAEDISASFIRFIQYPGISNCMTKMLNGISCGTVVTDDNNIQNVTHRSEQHSYPSSAINVDIMFDVGDNRIMEDCIDNRCNNNTNNNTSKSLSSSASSSSITLNATHVYNAKEVLQSMLYFGLTEYFQTSICQLSWLYGGTVKPFHFQTFREGKYNKILFSYDTLLPTTEDRELFLKIERYDIEVYRYAKQLFLDRLKLTGCPIIDNIGE